MITLDLFIFDFYFCAERDEKMSLIRISLNLSAAVFVEVEIPLRRCLFYVYGLDSGVCARFCMCVCAH